MRNAGRLKLGYYPHANRRGPEHPFDCWSPSAPYAAIDPCVGDGTALIEITKETGASLAGIELDADRAAAAGARTESRQSTVAHSSAAYWQKPAHFCISIRPTTASSGHTVIREWSWCSWNTAIAG